MPGLRLQINSQTPKKPKGPKAESKAKGGGKLQKLWCADFLKGKCNRGDACLFPHIPEESVQAMKAALANTKKGGQA